MSELIKVKVSSRPAESAVLFVHGFTGTAEGTWGNFPLILAASELMRDWDILSLGYPTSFLPGTRGIWSSDPNLPNLAIEFATELRIKPLANYKTLAIAAHSMGGLIAQRAIVDNFPALKDQVKYLFLFGTPSAGIPKANLLVDLFGSLMGEQVGNMATDSKFIRELRGGWTSQFGGDVPFQFYAIAGDKDQFVTTETALEPFGKKYWRVVTGDHLKIVKPQSAEADVVRLVLSALAKTPEPAETKSELRLAADMGDRAPEGVALAKTIFAKATAPKPELLYTQSEVVNAALTIDREGRRSEAVALLERYKHFGTDVTGTLAGRIKRRWIQENGKGDAEWALFLYEDALATARAKSDIDQIFYLAINVAFLKLVAFDAPQGAADMARLALENATKKSPPDVWSIATEAEAWLYLGDEQKALAKYAEVIRLSPDRWKLVSTSQQGQQVAAKQGKSALEQQIKALFEPQLSTGIEEGIRQSPGAATRSSEAPAQKKNVYLSYAWGGESSSLADELRAVVESEGFRFVRDKDDMQAGDRISSFMGELEKADLVIVVLSAKYLRSQYCMSELSGIYQYSRSDKNDFLKRVIPLTLPDAAYATWKDRKSHAQHWRVEYEEMEKSVKDLGQQDLILYFNMRGWQNSVGDILVYVNDVLHPHALDQIAGNSYQALRTMLRNRGAELSKSQAAK